MAKMKAAMAAVLVMEKEGVTHAFGVPGAAINPLYAQMRERQTIAHVLARHVEGASHMAEGYTRARAGNIGVCIGTSGPAGTDMITGLYSAQADSIPILCITGQAPRARMHKEDFQAVDIASIAKPVTKWATTVLEPAQVPRAFQQAFHLMRSGRPGPVLIDLPFDVQMAEIEFDIDTYEPMAVYKPTASRKQIEKALEMLNVADKPLIVAGGGIINADATDLLQQFARSSQARPRRVGLVSQTPSLGRRKGRQLRSPLRRDRRHSIGNSPRSDQDTPASHHRFTIRDGSDRADHLFQRSVLDLDRETSAIVDPPIADQRNSIGRFQRSHSGRQSLIGPVDRRDRLECGIQSTALDPNWRRFVGRDDLQCDGTSGAQNQQPTAGDELKKPPRPAMSHAARFDSERCGRRALPLTPFLQDESGSTSLWKRHVRSVHGTTLRLSVAPANSTIVGVSSLDYTRSIAVNPLGNERRSR